MTQTVIIFRMQLFKVSEAFITNQVLAFTRYTPVFAGQSLFGHVPAGSTALTTHGDKPKLARALSQIVPNDAGLADKLTAFEPKLVHAHFAIDGLYAVPVAEKLKIPLLVTLHGFDVTRSNLSLLTSCRPALINSVLWRSYLQNRATGFICVSNFIRNAAIQRGFPEEKLVVHYIGTDVDAFTPMADGSIQNLNVIHVARLTEKKGTTYLLRAFSKLANNFPEATLTIVGDGPLRDSLEKEARTLGIAPRVHFFGSVPFEKTQRLIAQSSVLVLPSITAANGDAEGLGMVTQEAGALGIPIVVTDSGGIAEAVIDGMTGYIVPEKDVDALADRIGRLLREPETAQQMGNHARTHIEENFNVKIQSAKLETIYDEFAARGRAS